MQIVVGFVKVTISASQIVWGRVEVAFSITHMLALKGELVPHIEIIDCDSLLSIQLYPFHNELF